MTRRLAAGEGGHFWWWLRLWGKRKKSSERRFLEKRPGTFVHIYAVAHHHKPKKT